MEMTRRVTGIVASIILVVSVFAGCAPEQQKVTFADPGWDSVKFHNAVAGFIAVSAFGFDDWQEMTGTTPVTHEGILNGQIDVHMEEWTDNLATYQADLDAGKLIELSVNFDDNNQGFYVPRYVIEGDAERGIEPMAPDLRTVQDLVRYKDVFPDDEQKSKGRIYGAIPGWEIDEIMHKKYVYNGLDQDFIYFRPGSDAALSAALTSAYEKGEAIVGYYWEPTWLLGKYDFVLLEDIPYENEERFKAGETACPAVRVTIAVSNDFAEKNEEFVAFLRNYSSSSALTSEALAHMQETGDDHTETAKWFLKKYDEFLDKWMSTEKAELVRKAIK